MLYSQFWDGSDPVDSGKLVCFSTAVYFLCYIGLSGYGCCVTVISTLSEVHNDCQWCRKLESEFSAQTTLNKLSQNKIGAPDFYKKKFTLYNYP